MLRYFAHELREEAADFFEDFHEFFFHIRRQPPRIRQVMIGGVLASVRPAYLFAERVDNALKMLFGGSIVLSGVTATFIGFTKLSDLLEVLIFSIPGRILMVIIGLAYLLTAFWRLLGVKDATRGTRNEKGQE